MADKTVFFTSRQGNGSVIIDEKMTDPALILERIKDLAGITHDVKIVDELPPVIETVVSDSLYAVTNAYIQAKNAIVGTEDTSLWDIKYDLAKRAVADEKEAQDTLKTMLTKKDFDANKKDALQAIKAVAKKIIEKQEQYRVKILALDNIMRNYKQSTEGSSKAEDVAAAAETAVRQFKLLVKE